MYFLLRTSISDERKIEVKETTFLRNAISGKTAFDSSAEKTVYYTIGGQIIFNDGLNGKWVSDGEQLVWMSDSITRPVGEDISALVKTPRAEGYIFEGWYDQSFQTKYEFTTMPSGVLTVYAKWTGIKYKAILNANGGSCEVDAVYISYGSPYGFLPQPTKEGYVFGGWMTEEGYIVGSIKNEQGVGSDYVVNIIGEQTLTAVWIGSKLEFNGNGATGGTTESICGEPDSKVNLPKCDYVREGYVFIGWNTDSDGSGTSFYEGESVGMPADGKTFVFYAQWALKE